MASPTSTTFLVIVSARAAERPSFPTSLPYAAGTLPWTVVLSSSSSFRWRLSSPARCFRRGCFPVRRSRPGRRRGVWWLTRPALRPTRRNRPGPQQLAPPSRLFRTRARPQPPLPESARRRRRPRGFAARSARSTLRPTGCSSRSPAAAPRSSGSNWPTRSFMIRTTAPDTSAISPPRPWRGAVASASWAPAPPRPALA